MNFKEKRKKTNFYFLKLENDADSLFNIFVNKFFDSHYEEIIQIQTLIKKIGNEIGAKKTYFRFEKEAGALPKASFIETDLRLYCLRLNDNIVFIFSGCLKTAQKVKDCKNCKPHFDLANKLTKAITNLIHSKEITYDKNYTDIIFDKDLEIEL